MVSCPLLAQDSVKRSAARAVDPGRCLEIPTWWDDTKLPHFSFISVVEKQDLIWKKPVVEYLMCDSRGQMFLLFDPPPGAN